MTHLVGPLPSVEGGSPPAVGVFRFGSSFRLLATALVPKGATLLRIAGVTVATASRHSIQVGVDEHLEAAPDTPLPELLDRYAWRFLNHSCTPNAAILGRELIALREIAPWEEVTFDYNTTEYDMACPFPCSCGAPSCVGEVRGFAHLTPEARHRVVPHAAPHVLELELQAARSPS